MVLFVYYKFAQGQFVTLPEQLLELRARVSIAYPAVSMRVMRRPEIDSKLRETWMEMYEISAQELLTLPAFLEQCVASLGMPGERASEVFEDVVQSD